MGEGLQRAVAAAKATRVKSRDVLARACPTCGAHEGSLCKRLTPGRFTHIDGFHKARRDEAAEVASDG